ncbi:MAG: Xaa-Pro peptidase family protein [Pseudomonadota bacterium]
MTTNTAILLIGSSKKDPDLFYATNFLTEIPGEYLSFNGKSYYITRTIEEGRAKKESSVDEVLVINNLIESYNTKQSHDPELFAIMAFLKDNNIKDLIIPEIFNLSTFNTLKENGFSITINKDIPFFKARKIKKEAEKCIIKENQTIIEEALLKAENLLKASRIENGNILYEGEIVTSELLKTLINGHLFSKGMFCEDMIVACGNDSTFPHLSGSGPIKANETIIFDIAPKSFINNYFGDMTRTFVKGKASKELKKMHQTVRDAQEMAIDQIHDGLESKRLHEKILAFFDSQGFKTGMINDRYQGFFHGTGHGIGLEIHETPIINANGPRLEKGNITSIEPGLYYEDIGGVRIEDLVYIKNKGCENLNNYHKNLEIE